MRLNNADDAANLMSSKATGTSDTQRLKPQLGIITAPAFAFALTWYGAYTEQGHAQFFTSG